jgi:tetratricopeptide (TPR) repeat protein
MSWLMKKSLPATMKSSAETQPETSAETQPETSAETQPGSSADTRRTTPSVTVKAARIAGCLFLLLAGPLANAASGSDLYREAQAAFRSGDYAEAAELFMAADKAGHDDPVAFYNAGVAYFRLGEFDRAEAAFATAAAFDQLAPMAYYNLGLIARREDDYRNARGWFRQAGRHPDASIRLRQLSRQASASLPTVRRTRPTVYNQDPEPRFTDFVRFSFDTGYGTDSNVFRAPKDSYVDISQAGAPTVVPLVQSGSFVPLDADLEFRWAPYEHGHFSIRYDFDGKVYTKEEQKNANAFRNRFSFGGRVHIPKEKGYRYFRSFFAIARYDENYYDRTDGGDIFVGTTNIADRFKRTKFGPHVYYHRERGRFGYGFSAEAFLNKYDNKFEDEPEPRGSLDYLDLTHEQYQVGAHVSFDLLKHTALRVSYDRYRRDYTRRLAKAADGVRYSNNDPLQLDYQDMGVKMTQDLGRRVDVSLAYQFTQRSDNFEGYDDYDRHSGLASIAFRTRRLGAEAGIVYRTYDFPNGFAFDEPLAGDKTLDRMFAYFEASYRIRQRYHIMASAELDAVDATDPRSAYDRNLFSVGMRWRL